MTNRQIFSHIFFYLAPYKWSLCIVMLSILGVSGVILGLGKAIKILIDAGITSGDLGNLNNAIIYIAILIAILGVTSFTRSYFINSLSERVIRDIRCSIYRHLLTLKFRQFELLKDSDIVSRMFSDIDLISRIIIDLLSFCIRNSVLFLGGIYLMFNESVKLSLMTLVIVPVVLLCISSLGKKVRALSRDTQANIASIAEYVGETFRGVRAIYAANAQEYKNHTFIDRLDTGLCISLKRLRLRALFFALAITTIMCSITFVVWVGSKDVLHHNMSAGQLVSFIIYAAYSGVSIGGIFEVFGDFQRYSSGAERVFEMLKISDIESTKQPQDIDFAHQVLIQCQSVSFAYPSRSDVQVLKDLSFEINRGEFIGIVGRSGNGKSTIAQLLLNFFSVSSGQILIAGQNIQSISPMILRKYLAYVPQDPFMFSDSISNNLTLTQTAGADINHIMHITGLDSFISQLPDGLDTYIGTSGTQISGGQRQRIAICRALLNTPEILLLDEATSALDHESEQRIMANLKHIMQNKTIISIAHRTSSIERADKILVIDDGRLLSIGSHTTLLATCDLYRKLCNEEVN